MGRGIKPRSTAMRRDKMLSLMDWVHLATRPDTPLLRDKLARGYPHALLVFDRAAVLALPHVALLPYNTKAWRSRSAYVPVIDAAEKTGMLRRHDQAQQYPSLEVLVQYGLDLTHLQKVVFADAEECGWVSGLMTALEWRSSVQLEVEAGLTPLYAVGGDTRKATQDYLTVCRAIKELLPPPEIKFD